MRDENKQHTIEDAAILFRDWRESTPKQKRIPDKLWSVVHDLTNRYPLSKILTRLGLTHAQYKAKRDIATAATQPISFVGLDVETNQDTQQVISVKKVHSCCDIELKKPNGTTLIIHNANEQVLSSLIASFVR